MQDPDALRAQLDRMEAKLDLLLNGPEQPVITAPEAQRLMGCSSKSSFNRMCSRLGVKSFIKNRYRRAEITHAMLKARIQDQQQMRRQADVEHELRTEAL